MSRSLILTCLVLFLSENLAAQSEAKSDPEVSTQLLLDKAASVQNPSEALSYLNQAIEYTDDINDSLKTYLNFSIGLNYGRQYINDSANLYLNKALGNASPHPHFKLLRSDIYNSLGNVARSQSLNEAAMNYFNKALMELEDNESKERYSLETKILGNIGGIYFDLQDYEKSLYYAERSKAITIKNGFKDKYLISYLMVAYAARALGNLDVALENNQLALTHVLEESDSSYIAHLYHNIATIYKLKNQWAEAIKNFDRALEIAQLFGEEELVVSVLLAKSEYFLDQGQLSEAFILAEEIKVSAGSNGLLPKVIQALDIQYAVLKAQEKYLEALNNREYYLVLKDSLFKVDTKEKIADIEIKYETQQKEQTILQLEQEKAISQLQAVQEKQLRYIMFLVATILLLAAGWALYRYRIKVRTSRILDVKNEELQSLNATKDRLFAIISHDLKSPLSAFSTVTSSLSQNIDKLEKDQIKDFLISLRDSSKNLYDMMNNLLHWALTQTGQVPYKPEMVDVGNLLKDIVSQLRLAIDTKDLKVAFDLDKDLNMESDANMLTIIFRNIIANAVKFSHNEKEIKISAHKSNGSINVQIEDQGIGLSEEDQLKLFTFENDIQKIGNSKEKGTGLGLRLCKELTDKLSGAISVSSSFGQGTMFRLSFPLN